MKVRVKTDVVSEKKYSEPMLGTLCKYHNHAPEAMGLCLKQAKAQSEYWNADGGVGQLRFWFMS